MSYSTEAQYDEQGKYFYATCKIAGWDEKRVTALLIQKFKKSHWNVLTAKEKKQMIAMMNKYAKPERDKRKVTMEKRIRQGIMAIWISTGHTHEEMHALMKDWGFGSSLRACNMKTLQEISRRVKDICQPIKERKRGM